MSKNGKVTKYVDEQMLTCIRSNRLFPQDVQISKTIFLTFGSCGLTVTRVYSRATREKHLNGWQEMTAAEINRKLSEIEYVSA